jgi:hypothetical protein
MLIALGTFAELFPSAMVERMRQLIGLYLEALGEEFKSKVSFLSFVLLRISLIGSFFMFLFDLSCCSRGTDLTLSLSLFLTPHQKPELSVIAGALEGLSGVLVQARGDFNSNPANVRTVYGYLCLALQVFVVSALLDSYCATVFVLHHLLSVRLMFCADLFSFHQSASTEDLKRYQMPRAALQLLGKHAELFAGHLTVCRLLVFFFFFFLLLPILCLSLLIFYF